MTWISELFQVILYDMHLQVFLFRNSLQLVQCVFFQALHTISNDSFIFHYITLYVLFQKKCERYWPLSQANDMIKENFLLQLKSEKTYANFVIHELIMLNREVAYLKDKTSLQYIEHNFFFHFSCGQYTFYSVLT